MSAPEAPPKEKKVKETADQQALMKKVAERVWQLWQQDMRHNRERTGKQRGSKR
jgi:hypothetical protein